MGQVGRLVQHAQHVDAVRVLHVENGERKMGQGPEAQALDAGGTCVARRAGAGMLGDVGQGGVVGVQESLRQWRATLRPVVPEGIANVTFRCGAGLDGLHVGLD